MQRYCVYSFTSVIVDFTIKAHFLNSEQFRKSGADHSLASLLRQDWAIQIVHTYNEKMANLDFKVRYRSSYQN